MAATWQVTGQRQTSVLENGSFEQAMVVTFKTADGVVSSVTVPLSQYNADHVRQLISEQVERISAVHTLASGPPTGS
jgi:hypothetical protein